jgi:hypothetical protein
MTRVSILAWVVISALSAVEAASAQQIIPPGGSQFNSPLPPPLPPPNIAPPVIPKLDAPAPLPGVPPSARGSFSDRISRCLDEGAAAGLGPSDRAAYSRSCANQ